MYSRRQDCTAGGHRGDSARGLPLVSAVDSVLARPGTGRVLSTPVDATTRSVRTHQHRPAPPNDPEWITNVQVVDLDRDGLQDVVVCERAATACSGAARIRSGHGRTSRSAWISWPRLMRRPSISTATAISMSWSRFWETSIPTINVGRQRRAAGKPDGRVRAASAAGRRAPRGRRAAGRLRRRRRPRSRGRRLRIQPRTGPLAGEPRGTPLSGSTSCSRRPERFMFPSRTSTATAIPTSPQSCRRKTEEVWTFENTGGGTFTPHRVFETLNFDLGTAGLVASDLDGDGDVDLILPAGDNLEDIHSFPQPYHGCYLAGEPGELEVHGPQDRRPGGNLRSGRCRPRQ